MKQVYLKIFQRKREISIVLMLALALGIFPINFAEKTEVKAAESEYGISNPRTDSDGVTTWDCVWFGNYWQNDTNGDGKADQSDEKEPIKWRVLSVNGDEALLLADTVLDGQDYNETNTSITWEKCTLRAWLNNTFLENACNESEQAAIKITSNVNADNPYSGRDGGNNTDDSIFLLSIDEACDDSYGFVLSYETATETRYVKPSTYAIGQGAMVWSESDEYCRWWLRSAGYYNNSAAAVRSDGSGYQKSHPVWDCTYGIRPALHLDLSSSVWTYAGTEISGMEKAKTVSTTGALYQSDAGNGNIELSCDETILAENSFTYHHNLAIFAAGMATMLYNETEENVQTALKNLGYLNVESVSDLDGKTSPYWIAHKTVSLNGKKTNIVGIFIRGTYKEEWIDNFDSGYGEKVHKGFNNAADYVYKGLCDYIAENGLTDSQMKILVTGHSRGAAAANLLGYRLDEDGLSGVNVTSRDIFVYTFATPNTTAKNDKNSSEYYNIYNIVNPEDFVTKVMPSKWGYGRYGQTFVLPSSSTETVIPIGNYVRYYSEYLPELKKQYKQYRPNDQNGYAPYVKGMEDVYKYVKSITSIVPNAEEYYTKNLQSHKKTQDVNMSQSLQKLFTYTLGYNQSKTSPYKEISTKAIMDALAFRWGVTGATTLAFFGVHEVIGGKIPVISPAFSCAHRAETYLAAMNILSEKQLRQKRSYLWGTVNCPVDVTIKDGDGNVIGKIVDNVVDDTIEEGVQIDVEGDSKTFALPQDASYTIELTGNDDGVMDYSLSVMDADSGESERTFYQAVPIKKGQTMTQSVLEESELPDIDLLNEDSQVIGTTNYFQSDDLGQLSAEVEVEGIGSANGAYNVTAGDYVILSAIADENNSFLGWYDEEDKLLSTEGNYGISVNENISLKAKFTNVVVDSTDIIFDKEEVKMIVGDMDINSATIIPSNATNKNIMYSSSDEAVVTVGDYGLLTAIGKGTATITAVSEDGKAIANSKITVSETTDDPSDVVPTETGNPKPTPTITNKPVNTTKEVKKPNKVTGLKVKSKKKKVVTLTWKKVSGAKGYQLQYALNKKFTKKKESKFTKKKKLTVKKLKSKKTYYFRVRAYKLNGKKKVYGKWSKVKKIKIKK